MGVSGVNAPPALANSSLNRGAAGHLWSTRPYFTLPSQVILHHTVAYRYESIIYPDFPYYTVSNHTMINHNIPDPASSYHSHSHTLAIPASIEALLVSCGEAGWRLEASTYLFFQCIIATAGGECPRTSGIEIFTFFIRCIG